MHEGDNIGGRLLAGCIDADARCESWVVDTATVPCEQAKDRRQCVGDRAKMGGRGA